MVFGEAKDQSGLLASDGQLFVHRQRGNATSLLSTNKLWKRLL